MIAGLDIERLTAFLKTNARLDEEQPTALYLRLAEGLRAAIREKIAPAGGAIPGERELATALGVARVTVRKAIQELVDEELLIRRTRARTSVAARVEKPAAVFSSFSEDMEARGLRPGGEWLARSVAAATPSEALALGLSPGDLVSRLKRLRTADDMPLALETSVVPNLYLPDPSAVGSSLYAALEAAGHAPVRALQRLRSVVAAEEAARLLDVDPGAPLFDVERRVFLASGTVVEYCHSLYRGDTYDFVMELNRSPRGSA